MNAYNADYLRSYRHRLVVPDLPTPAEYLPLLEEMQENGWYSNFGPLVRRLESRLLATYGAAGETCVTCCNGTAGLSAALLATGRTDQVLLPAFTFPASLAAVRAAGMTTIVADVDAKTWTLAGNLLDRALVETGARVVMLVAPFGIRSNWEAELVICREHGAAVVIDNASGLGGPRPVKGFSDEVFEVFSMHATKPFGVGEGGVIFAHRKHDAGLRSALNFALNSYAKPGGLARGFNGKMSEFHAAIGIVQLDRIGEIVSRRQAFADIYRERLAHYPEIVCPQDMNCAPWQVFPVLLPSVSAAEGLIEIAAAAGVEIRRYYRPSLSRWPETRRFEACPVAEDIADRMCALPVRGVTACFETNQVADLVLNALDRALTRK
ncbi:MAG: DegT/DnrJ/EryC1/StrS family aminotransferase [Methylocella sp.]